MREPHLDLLALARRLLEVLLASARTLSRTSSLTSRETLRIGAVLHFAFNEQAEQSLFLAL
jgi:hypothetical protein